MSTDDRVKPKLWDEALRAQCVPAVPVANKRKKAPLVRQDSNEIVYTSDEDTTDEDTTDRNSHNNTVSLSSADEANKTICISSEDDSPSHSPGGSQSSAASKSTVREASEKISPTVKSVQKIVADNKIGEPPKEKEAEESSNHPAKPSTKRSQEYVLVSFNRDIEDQINNCSNLKQLNEDQIYYFVLRDVNRLIDIFSGCLESWRHEVFNENPNHRLLYENSALSNFTHAQFMSAFRGLETIFCKKSHKYCDYLMSVLLPEVLIAICARVYECTPASAEEFLRVTHSKSDLETEFPEGSLKATKLTQAHAKITLSK